MVVTGAPRPAPALLERANELSRLNERLREAQAGRGGAVVIEGVAGIGKTALLSEVRRSAEAHGMRCLRARGAELERWDVVLDVAVGE
jgi:MoxR-like ATPase